MVPVDLATTSFVGPLLAAGFDTTRPTIVVWEGVINYLSASAAEQVVHQMGSVLAPGGQLVADYVEMSWFRGAEFERSTAFDDDRDGFSEDAGDCDDDPENGSD